MKKLLYSRFILQCHCLFQLAEGKQEELTQKGQNEKKELQLRIEEMEEKEQALQARIEALQADNDFTNERLTALQGITCAHTRTQTYSYQCLLSLVRRAKNLPSTSVSLQPGSVSVTKYTCFTVTEVYGWENLKQ